jgi:hypothetical protein
MTTHRWTPHQPPSRQRSRWPHETTDHMPDRRHGHGAVRDGARGGRQVLGQRRAGQHRPRIAGRRRLARGPLPAQRVRARRARGHRRHRPRRGSADDRALGGGAAVEHHKLSRAHRDRPVHVGVLARPVGRHARERWCAGSGRGSDPRLVTLLAAIGRRHRIIVTALRADHAPGTNHQVGRAVDIGAVDREICQGTRTGPCAELVYDLARVRGELRSTELIYCF